MYSLLWVKLWLGMIQPIIVMLVYIQEIYIINIRIQYMIINIYIYIS